MSVKINLKWKITKENSRVKRVKLFKMILVLQTSIIENSKKIEISIGKQLIQLFFSVNERQAIIFMLE